VALTFKTDKKKVKINRFVKYLSRRSLSSKLLPEKAHRHIHVQKRLVRRTTKVVGKNLPLYYLVVCSNTAETRLVFLQSQNIESAHHYFHT